jgi:hypothetical protein
MEAASTAPTPHISTVFLYCSDVVNRYTWSSGDMMNCTWNNGFCHEWMQANAAIIQARVADAVLLSPSEHSNLLPETVVAKTQVSEMLTSVQKLIQNSDMNACVHPDESVVATDCDYSTNASNSLLDCGARKQSVIPLDVPETAASKPQFERIEGTERYRCLRPCTKACYKPIADGSRYYHAKRFHSGAPDDQNSDYAHTPEFNRSNATTDHQDDDPTAAKHKSRHVCLSANLVNSDSQSHAQRPESKSLVESSSGKKLIIYGDGSQYDGECNSRGVAHGKGKMSHKCGDLYVGEFHDGLKHGHGTYKYANQSFYNGLWKNGKKEGKGVSVYKTSGSVENYGWSAGDIFDGEYAENIRHGPCEYTWFNGDKLRCVWVHGKCPEWTKMNDDILACANRNKSPDPHNSPEISVLDAKYISSSSEASTSPPPAPRPPGIYNRSPAMKRHASAPPQSQAASQNYDRAKLRGMDKNGW